MSSLCALTPILFFLPLVHAASVRVIVLEGDASINNIRQKTLREPVVRVEDGSGEPLRGATVTFTLPVSGPSAVFLDGSYTASFTTGDDGIAAARGLRPNNVVGPFEIRVNAVFSGERGNAVIRQTNASPLEATTVRNKRRLWIAGLVAGGAVAGILAGTLGGGGNSGAGGTPPTSPPAARPPIVLAPGNGGFGAPGN